MKFSKIILILVSLIIAGTAELKADGLYLRPVKSEYPITPGSTADVQFHVDLPQGATALQFTVHLPVDFELVSDNLIVNDANLQARVHWDGEYVDTGLTFWTFNIYKFVLYSADNSPIDGSGDYLFTLRLKARDTSTLGQKVLFIRDVYAADASGSETLIYDGTVDVRIVDSMPAERIVLRPTFLYLKVGESVALTATVLPDDATDKTVTWSSSNEAVATVDADGKVTAVALGEAVITAKCGEISATCTVTIVPTPVESITLNQTTASLKVGESVILTATVLPEDATDKTVTWSSSNESVATVDADGKVTAVALGEATITATCGDVSATCTVTIVPTPVESITLNQTTASLKVGESVALNATVLPEDATDKTVTWSSSNESVATVDADGNVTAIALGEATITATCGDVSATCTVTIVLTPAESISINQSSAQLKIGESVTLTATVSPETTTDKTVTWSSSNESVATVDAHGKVTAIALGEAIITAKCGEISATCTVTVEATVAESISLNQSSAQLKVGESVTLTATVSPETTTDKTVTWSSSNEAVATVDTNGTVTALSLGDAVITATCGDVSATCTVTIVPTPVESITLNQTTALLHVGECVSLTATVLPEDATDKTVTWSSSDEAVATVDTNGKVTAVALGETTITATCGDVSATCDVSVLPILVESITLTPDEWSGVEGDNIQLVAVVMPENATDKSLTWTSSDETVATVDDTGRVRIIKEGNCVVTATANDGSGITSQCIVTGLSGIEAIYATGDEKIDVYTPGGVLLKIGCEKSELQQLTPGIYILRNGHKVVKAILR